MSEETYNSYGPECPYCHHIHRDLEAWAYDENGSEQECDSCGKPFFMVANCSWSWSCKDIKP